MKTIFTILTCLCGFALAAQCNGAGGPFPAFGFTPGPPPIDDSKQFALQVTGLPVPDTNNGELDYFAAVTAEGNVVGCGPVSSDGTSAVGTMNINFECGNTVQEALNCAATIACGNCESFQVFYYDASTQLFHQLENTGSPNAPLEFQFTDSEDNGDGTFGDGVVDGYGATEAVTGANTENIDGLSGTPNFGDFFQALPVSLIAFSGNQNDKTIDLTWSTASETSNESFTIERSAAGENFIEIGEVTGAGDSQVAIDYDFTDDRPVNGNNFYRLRQNDLDGSTSYSSVLLVDFQGADAGAMTVSPNPATDFLSIRLSGNWAAESVNGTLLEASGRVVRDWQQLAGTSSSIDLAGVPAGIYQVMMTDGKNRQVQRVVVR